MINLVTLAALIDKYHNHRIVVAHTFLVYVVAALYFFIHALVVALAVSAPSIKAFSWLSNVWFILATIDLELLVLSTQA